MEGVLEHNIEAHYSSSPRCSRNEAHIDHDVSTLDTSLLFVHFRVAKLEIEVSIALVGLEGRLGEVAPWAKSFL